MYELPNFMNSVPALQSQISTNLVF